MYKKTIFAVIGILLITSLACSSLDALLPDVQSSENADSIKLADDFSKKGSGWEVGIFDGGEIGYYDGKYRITSIGDGNTMWGAAGRSFEDMVIAVDAEQISAPDNNNNDYGVICRLQQDGGGYYGLISGDGFYTILRGNGDQGFDILVDWAQSRIIRQGNALNQLQLACEGSRIQLSVNGQLLAETTDTKYASGDIGFTSTSYELDGTEVHFDNLTVK